MKLLLVLALCGAVAACSDSNEAAPSGAAGSVGVAGSAGSVGVAGTTGVGGSGGSGGVAGEAGSGGSGGANPAPAPRGKCSYVNPFSKGMECKEYTGKAWTEASAAEDCEKKITGAPGVFAAGESCSFASSLGRCVVPSETGEETVVHNEGDDASKCQSTGGGCKLFAKGTFEPGNTCDGSGGSGGSGGGQGYGSTPFVQPYLACKDPLPGEPPGKGENGQVCTWTLISGCTEEGRRFDDYASCADVLTQRPYYPTPPYKTTDPADPRLADQAYMAEVSWAKAQAEASACVCCHTKRAAPEGPSQWFTDGDGVWLDTITDSGLAMMAGLADSTALGAYPAAENNGFDRAALGIPTTDIPRMKALLLAEWARRGFTPEDGAKYEPFGGPLVDQLNFKPSPCEEGEGVDATGKITWAGGEARYLYILAKDAPSPGVPPVLDQPAGTVWFADVPTASPAFASGVTYGKLSGALRQRLPASGEAPALVPGETYHLHVLRDIGFPITRCLFTAP